MFGAPLRFARALLGLPAQLAGALAAARRLPPLLPPGVIEVATPAPEGGAPLLRTRLAVSGDAVTTIAEAFLALPGPEQTRLSAGHHARLRAVLEDLGRVQRGLARLGGVALGAAGAAAGGIPLAGIPWQQAAPAMALPCALAALGIVLRAGLARRVLRWLGVRGLARLDQATPSREARLIGPATA